MQPPGSPWWCLPALFTAFLCDFLGRILGLEFISFTWIHGIPTYLWLEITLYGPVMWLALTQVNADVFGDVPTEPEALRRHHRLQFAATVAIAILLYGVGVHVTDTSEVLSREREHVTDGAVYELVYFLDEGFSHFIQFFALFFVMGWFLIYDRVGRTASPSIALFLGVVHGIERGVGIIEGEKVVPRSGRDRVDDDRGLVALAARGLRGGLRVLLPPRRSLLRHPAPQSGLVLHLVRFVRPSINAERQ